MSAFICMQNAAYNQNFSMVIMFISLTEVKHQFMSDQNV